MLAKTELPLLPDGHAVAIPPLPMPHEPVFSSAQPLRALITAKRLRRQSFLLSLLRRANATLHQGGTILRGGLLGVALATGGGMVSLLPSSPALAQQLAPNCPLPQEIAATFLNATCTKATLPAAQTFYRYFSSPQNRYGRYLTTDRFSTNVEVISKLALNQAWGNKAERELSVTLPAGTVVYQGIVGPQTPTSCYPGGAQQTFIENSKDPAIVWTDGPTLTLKPFQCNQP
ncbi:MAG: hypothetical protein ACKN89_02660 [Cyanobium sp.]